MKTLNLLVLKCGDLERAKTFYECMGLRFKREVHAGGPGHYAAQDGSAVFELYPIKPGLNADNTGLGFDVADLLGAFTDLNNIGFSPQPISEKPWGKTFVVRDPDGRRIELKEVSSTIHQQQNH